MASQQGPCRQAEDSTQQKDGARSEVLVEFDQDSSLRSLQSQGGECQKSLRDFEVAPRAGHRVVTSEPPSGSPDAPGACTFHCF